jgi:hypothetical protein
LKLNALITAPATISGGIIGQDIASGTLSFRALSPFSFNGYTGDNILTVGWTGGDLRGALGGTSLGLQVSAPSDVISYTSDFFAAADLIPTNFSIALSSVLPASHVGANGHLAPFRASAATTFSATTAVPEPATWAMLIVGFGLVGAAARVRARRSNFAHG